MTVRFFVATLAVITFSFVGCADQVEDTTLAVGAVPDFIQGSKADFGEGACSAYVHQASPDITVLKAELIGRFAPDTNTVPADFNVDCSACNVLSSGPYSGHDCQFYDICEELTLDCRNELESMTDMPFINGATFDNVVFLGDEPDEETSEPGSGKYYAQGFNCSVLEITTASRADALPFARRLGFWLDGEFTEFSLHDLQPVGEAHFRNGELATLHRFGAVAICWSGSMSSSMAGSHEFKPYLRFEANDRCYVNWDAAEDNYRISSHIRGFDRSHEVLQ